MNERNRGREGGIPYKGEEHSSKGSLPSEMRGKPRILVVEDHPDAREILAIALSAEGMTVETAGDGFEALEKAQNWSPDAVLLDLSLPKLDGFEVASRLTSDRSLRHVPVVAYTAHGSPEHWQRAMAAGCAAVLTKPTPHRVLAETLRQLLKPAAQPTPPTDPGLDDTATRLSKMGEAFRAALPIRIRELAQDWQEARTVADHVGPVSALCARAHQLAGSAAAYGFPELGRRVALLEQGLEDYLRRPEPSRRERIAEQIERLSSLASRLGTGQGWGAAGEH